MLDGLREGPLRPPVCLSNRQYVYLAVNLRAQGLAGVLSFCGLAYLSDLEKLVKALTADDHGLLCRCSAAYLYMDAVAVRPVWTFAETRCVDAVAPAALYRNVVLNEICEHLDEAFASAI